MLRYGSSGSITDTEEVPGKRYVRSLRLTLTDASSGQDPAKKVIKVVNGPQKRKNGYIQQESSHGADQTPASVTNGMRQKPTENGLRVFGVVQRVGVNSQQEVRAYEWPVDHLRDEMKYLREVRGSLEKVRETMSGQLDGVQQSAQKLSQDIQLAFDQRDSLESEVRVQAAAMNSFDRMTSSLVTSNIDLQKTLLESCSSRIRAQEDLRSLRSARQQAEARVMELEHQLASAHALNNTLKLQVDTSQEAISQRMEAMTLRLRTQYEDQLEEERRRHLEEVKALQAQITEYIARLEEAEEKIRIAEAKIAERDERISEIERLLDCMGKEKGQLEQKLQDVEQQQHWLAQTDEVDATTAKQWSQQLDGEATDLRDRIKHLNDMVFTQQKKVKGLIMEIDALREKVAQKDLHITDLLDRIAIVQCENNELEDKLKYFMSKENETEEPVPTRDIGVGCDLNPRPEEVKKPVPAASVSFRPVAPSPLPSYRAQPIGPTHSPKQQRTRTLPITIQQTRVVTSRTQSSSTRGTRGMPGRSPSSSSLNSRVATGGVQSSPDHGSLPRSGPAPPYSVQTSLGHSHAQGSPSTGSYLPAGSLPRPKTSPNKVYTPYMRLLGVSGKIV